MWFAFQFLSLLVVSGGFEGVGSLSTECIAPSMVSLSSNYFAPGVSNQYNGVFPSKCGLQARSLVDQPLPDYGTSFSVVDRDGNTYYSRSIVDQVTIEIVKVSPDGSASVLAPSVPFNPSYTLGGDGYYAITYAYPYLLIAGYSWSSWSLVLNVSFPWTYCSGVSYSWDCTLQMLNDTVLTFSNDPIYGSNTIYFLDVTTGNLIGNVTTQLPYSTQPFFALPTPTPGVIGDTIFILTGTAALVQAYEISTSALLWTFNISTVIPPNPGINAIAGMFVTTTSIVLQSGLITTPQSFSTITLVLNASSGALLTSASTACQLSGYTQFSYAISTDCTLYCQDMDSHGIGALHLPTGIYQTFPSFSSVQSVMVDSAGQLLVAEALNTWTLSLVTLPNTTLWSVAMPIGTGLTGYNPILPFLPSDLVVVGNYVNYISSDSGAATCPASLP